MENKGKELKEKLFDQKKCGFKNAKNIKNIMQFSDDYISFLNSCKTERECTTYLTNLLNNNGFVPIESKKKLSPGDKIYYINRNKSVYACIIGEDLLEDGLNLIGTHIDSPRLDLKPKPLYEKTDLALLKTHYYGGIKKYQWTTIPLLLKGVIVKTNGEIININIGEDKEDPIFTITDLLPHLGKKQGKKNLNEAIAGEDLNVLVGSIPYEDEEIDEKVKLNILKILNEKYKITERDFISSELELVPAFQARSLGFDKSMVAAYGQDDRSCAYTTIRALIELENVKKTSIAILADKEEIGSVGNTGMYSNNFELFINNLLDKCGQNDIGTLNQTLCNSIMLSADVTSATDPTYDYVDEKNNAAYLGRGVCLCKYTGHGGKSGASDANAEFVGKVRSIFENKNLIYQMSDMGKVEEGGGGTIAYILANRGIEVIDCGIPILSMHAPYEVSSKFDIYNAYECYKAFFQNEN